MSEEDSASDTTADDIEESQSTEIQQVHNVMNKATHDENDTSDENSGIEIEPPTNNGEQNNVQEHKLLTTNFGVKIEN